MKIELNKKLDKEVYLAFNDAKVGGTDFGKIIKRDHPNIDKDNYQDYIDSFYTENNDKLNTIISETEKCVKDFEGIFFDKLKKYFGKDYSNQEFKCYISIFDCNPRYIENKTFQVFYKRPLDLRKEVIIHEITHFAFYDYCFDLGLKDSKELWELSEIFNVLFLNELEMQKILGAEELLFYPALKDKLEKVRMIWDKKSDAKDFILKGLDLIS